MKVRAKFQVVEVTSYANGGAPTQTIRLAPVYGGTEENKAFFAATPAGKIELSCLKPEVAANLELGKEYYIDFVPTDAP